MLLLLFFFALVENKGVGIFRSGDDHEHVVLRHGTKVNVAQTKQICRYMQKRTRNKK